MFKVPPTKSGVTQAAEGIHVRPLRLDDAPAMAALEREVCPVDLQAGTAQLRVDLQAAELEDSNLGFGLFDGEALVGVLVAYYEPDVRRLMEYLDLPCPADLTAHECLFIADFSVKREYSRYTQRLVKGMWRNTRAEYRALPLYAFSSAAVVKRWRRLGRALTGIGYEYDSDRRFEIEAAPFEIHLVKFRVLAPYVGETTTRTGLHVREIRTFAGWSSLEPQWDALLRETPDSTGFQSFRVQRIWSRHLLRQSRLFILAVYQGTKLRAIAPLRIELAPYFGRSQRVLKFIGEPSEMDRPTILRRGDDRQAVRAVFDHIVARNELWDAALFYEQLKDGVLLDAATAVFATPDWLVGVVDGPPCPWVDLRGSWDEFLASKSRGFKKQLGQKFRRLERLGKVQVLTYDSWPGVSTGLEAYLAVEQRSWKPKKRLGVAKNRAVLDYHRALVNGLGPLGKVQLRVLALDDKPIAASFGLIEHGRFLSLHIAHDSAYDDYSPGMLLTAAELEDCYGRPEVTDYEFLGGFLNNKLTWTSNVRQTRQFYAYRRTPLFRVHYAWHFRIEPVIKKSLRRLGLLDALLKARAAVRRAIKGEAAEEAD